MAGVFIFTGLFVLLYHLTPSLSTEDAEKRVRLFLQRELSQKHMSVLKASGKKIPDPNMARQWQKEIRDIKSIKFGSVVVKRFIPEILLSEGVPDSIVKVTVLNNYQKPDCRYFWLSRDGMDRETSGLVWFFSI